ncbi:hypothetical protein ABDK00_003925 [Niabella insulamsoli]|uniref:hypothetical protein n=1 Tax=Niabella insulamsoli TaxID=3144874 RepID=UPI0031FCEB88
MKPVKRAAWFASAAITMFFGCNRDPYIDSVSYQVSVNIVIENKKGQSLLSTATPGYFKDGRLKDMI